MAHGRRQFVEMTANFPEEYQCLPDMLGRAYGVDAEARDVAYAQKRASHKQNLTAFLARAGACLRALAVALSSHRLAGRLLL